MKSLGTNEGAVFDVTIIGAGPSGLFAAFYAGMRNLSIHIIDSLPQVGGQLAALYPEKYIYDMPGFPKVLAKDLVKSLWEQAQLGKPQVTLNEKVSIIKEGPNSLGRAFEIQTTEGCSYLSKTVILALGLGAFTPRKLKIPGLEEREGKSVHYVLKPLDYYAGKEILVIGGGDSALDWALTLSKPEHSGKPLAKSLTLIHRGARFTAHEKTVEDLRSTSATIQMCHELLAVKDEHENGITKLRATIENNITKDQHDILVDEIIICTGYIAKLDFVKESGLEMTDEDEIVVSELGATNIPGIFAVGDVCSHEGKLALIATGAGEAAVAANFAKVFIDPTAKSFPGHSTSKLSSQAKDKVCLSGRQECLCDCEPVSNSVKTSIGESAV